MEYLRFGEIPENGKSVNFLKLTGNQKEDFQYMLDIGKVAEAYKELPKEAFEDGLSVFEMDDNRLPKLDNLQLVSSLLARLDHKIYEISGKEISKGNDGEPLVTGVKIEKKRRIDKEKLIKLALTTLLKNFKTVEYTKEDGNNVLHQFDIEYKININTGEKVPAFQKTDGNDWVKIPPSTQYTFNGWTFSNPVDGFDVKLGLDEKSQSKSQPEKSSLSDRMQKKKDIIKSKEKEDAGKDVTKEQSKKHDKAV